MKNRRKQLKNQQKQFKKLEKAMNNIEKTRKDTIAAQKKADAKALKDELNSTAVAKFQANLEARFYTALAKQITDNVFGSDGLQQDSGTYTDTAGNIITWATVTSGLSLIHISEPTRLLSIE